MELSCLWANGQDGETDQLLLEDFGKLTIWNLWIFELRLKVFILGSNPVFLSQQGELHAIYLTWM